MSEHIDEMTKFPMTEYCCREFEKAVEYRDFAYCEAEEDTYRAITKDGWYIYNTQYNRPLASLKPFKYCPWCAAKLKQNLP